MISIKLNMVGNPDDGTKRKDLKGEPLEYFTMWFDPKDFKRMCREKYSTKIQLYSQPEWEPEVKETAEEIIKLIQEAGE